MSRRLTRPIGITALIIFFVAGTLISFLAGLSLLTPSAIFNGMWRLNPHGHEGLLRIGYWAVALTVLTVAVLTATLDRLQKGKVLLDELFEQAPEAVVLMNEDQSIVRVNREFTRLFAYTPQEAVGRRLSEPQRQPARVQLSEI